MPANQTGRAKLGGSSPSPTGCQTLPAVSPEGARHGTPPDSEPIEELAKRNWDAVIVGTGMGGSVLGHALARAGWRVLFVEKGHAQRRTCNGRTSGEQKILRGAFAECFFPVPGPARPEHQEILERSGRCWEEIEDRTGDRRERFIPFLGCGTGGSSALYGMVMERLRPSDFRAWPLAYEELSPHYRSAERLFQVRGTADPLRKEGGAQTLLPPPPLHPANREMEAFLRRRGLHPYRLPMACAYQRGTDRCQGFLDRTGAKNDAASICLEPALADHGAVLLDRCEVTRLEATGERVTGVQCSRQGRPWLLRGRVTILAAGALATPCLLLRSSSALWPQGLANASGLVGRNLMRHLVDLYLVRAAKATLPEGNLKELAFNDWYAEEDRAHGTVQSFGCLPPAAQLVAELPEELHLPPDSLLRPLLRLGGGMLRRILQNRLDRSLILASVLEDPPRTGNRVRLGLGNESPVVLEYRLDREELAKVDAFRARMRRLLAPLGVTLLKQAENNRRLAHVCGTCRFGDDPQASVLDRFNRAHGLENLYVVDTSFFPTSGGMNPALTVAANALRVAEHLTERPLVRSAERAGTGHSQGAW